LTRIDRLILLVLEAGIDIDLTQVKLVGARGIIIALVGTGLPVVLAAIVATALGYGGIESIAAGCSFAPTSLGIAMNILRQSNIINTPVGQLIVAAAIIDDMIALVILSQLQAFVGDATVVGMIIPIVSALSFLVIGGYIAVYVLPDILDRYVISPCESRLGMTREFSSLGLMMALLMVLIPFTYYAKASPLMGAFLAGLVFCSSEPAHHMFVSQFKRVMQWLLRIFFAASIGFQVPIKSFANITVIIQGLLFTLALLGKVVVGFMVPNFSVTRRFRSIHLRDCLVVGFSMAAEGEFAFVIAVFAVSNGLITTNLYASIVLAVLLSTMVSPLLLRKTLSYFNKQIELEMAQWITDSSKEDTTGGPTGGPSKSSDGGGHRKPTFFCIQTKSEPAWGLQTTIMHELCALELDIIDHRSWRPRQGRDVLVNEVYVKDSASHVAAAAHMIMNSLDLIAGRIEEITAALEKGISQKDAIVRVQTWTPNLSTGFHTTEENSILEQIGEMSAEEEPREGGSLSSDDYILMDHADKKKKGVEQQQARQRRQHVEGIQHIDTRFAGRLDGLIRQDRVQPVRPMMTGDGIELLPR
jgi:Kef-type K+ transport system membrane component KefB